MNDEIKKSESTNIVYEYEDEIDLLELAKTAWNGRKLIILIVIGVTLATMVLSFFMTNIYTAKAVLKPASQGQTGGKLSTLASQFGGLATLAGIAMPSSASSAEIVNLLKSNILKKEVIENYQLLPVLFSDKWNKENQNWSTKKVPNTWDGIRALDRIVTVNYNVKEDIITISVDFPNPAMAAKIADYLIVSLNDHMSIEAKRIALINREYLQKQLLETNDPIVQQKIYNLIADKIETMMMAEVKEGFAFKVLDPPMAPDKKSKPKRAQMVIVAFIISLFLGVFWVLFREYLKNIKAKSAGGHNAK